MSAPNPRKRPAPGSLPMPQQPSSSSVNNADQLMRWTGNATAAFPDNTSAANQFAMMPSHPQGQPQYPTAPQASGALARRGANNALVPAAHTFDQPADSWSSFADDALVANPTGAPADETDNVEVLEERAQRAKREAQAKRKQIPPFVQKLNSFLEESKNTELIRWSQDGKSFIVLDEDEFAKTLIPELFKHNNYASFVRQLNMYGFHKKVGLSDNSMKASERKNKSPSEYYNPYFRRGHPNLLWLINKPKSNSSKKGGSKRQPSDANAEADSDDDAMMEDAAAQHTQPPAAPRALPAPPEASPAPLQKKELAVVRDQVAALQHQQKTISAAISKLKIEHDELYRQAHLFQNQHDRHENSINAILNFLANVFRKSLEEQGGANNINDLMANIIPNVQRAQAQAGSVVDLGDWMQQVPGASSAMTTPKRPQRLLPPIPNDQAGRAPSAESISPQPQDPPRMGSVTEVFDPPDARGTPRYLKHELESNPQEGMMRLIQNANTNSGNSPIDLPDIANNTSATMSNDQRDRMLNIMSGGKNSTSPTPGPSSASPTPTPQPNPANLPGPAGAQAGPSSSAAAAAPAAPSLSPLLQSMPPNLQRINQTQEEIDQLQRLQLQQSQKLENLNSLLGPLSPSGRIPGLDESSSNYFNNDDIDLNQYLDSSAFTADGVVGGDFNFDTPSGFDAANYDWGTGSNNAPDLSSPNLGGGGGGGSGSGGGGLGPAGGVFDDHLAPRVVETTTPSHNTASPSSTEEVPRDDLERTPERVAKRQRQT